MMKNKNPANKTKPRHKKLKKFLLCFSIAFICLFSAGFVYFITLYNKYDLDVNRLTSVNNGIKVYSADGVDNTLYNSNRSIVEIDSLPDYVPKAFVDIEDKRFYSHKGYDLKRIAKASMVNLTSKSKSQGASTISQQLIKNALLSNEKTYERKIKEIILSIKMEKQFSKSEILQMYLNTIYFGQNAYGIENASRIYFNKSAKDLTLNEACCLAGLIKSPAKYSPKINLQNALERRNLVAKNMLNQKDITSEQYNDVLASTLDVANTNNIDFSYEREAIYQACQLLNISERDLINHDYEIITNKNDVLQKQLININSDVIDSAKNTYNQNLDSISIVADNNGKIKAFFVNSNYNLHNMKRQPASMLKPFAVYLPCFEHNILSPATQILDEPINYNGFSPQNAGGGYSGYVSTRDAIAKSLNIPAVKALDYVGLNHARATLAEFGINTTNADANLTLALGSVTNGVDLITLTNAYSTLANQGTYKPLSFIDKIKDKQGNVIYSSNDYAETILDTSSCFLLNDCLKETTRTGTAKRLNSLQFPVASKTGTAYDGKNNTDLFNVAYTTEHTVLTWVADIKDNKLDNRLYSSAQPTEINKQILLQIYNNHKPTDFEKPEDIVKTGYDLPEYEQNHNIIAPLSNLDRYIAYDYFKQSNLPQNKQPEQTELVACLNKTGCYLYFDAQKYDDYKIEKITASKSSILKEVFDTTGKIEILDNDIFSHEEISYNLLKNSKIIATTKIKPKEYLIRLIESQMLNGKSKWFV